MSKKHEYISSRRQSEKFRVKFLLKRITAFSSFLLKYNDRGHGQIRLVDTYAVQLAAVLRCGEHTKN